MLKYHIIRSIYYINYIVTLCYYLLFGNPIKVSFVMFFMLLHFLQFWKNLLYIWHTKIIKYFKILNYKKLKCYILFLL